MTRRRRARSTPSLNRFARLPWRSIGRIVAAAGLGAVTVGTAWWGVPRGWHAARGHAYFAVTELAVRGNSRIARDDLMRWAELQRGMSIWDADPVRVRARLRAHPDIEDASIRRDFPRRVVLRVRERTPVAIALLDELYYVDRSGVVMSRVRAQDNHDLPLITGVGGADLDGGSALLLRRAVRLIRLCQRYGCGTGLSEVHVDVARGVTIMPLHHPTSIVLGWGRWRAKLARTTRVLAAWEGREARLAQLDASFANQVVVRLRAQPDQAGTKTKPGTPKTPLAKPGVRV
jgi:hypothetical protein